MVFLSGEVIHLLIINRILPVKQFVIGLTFGTIIRAAKSILQMFEVALVRFIKGG